MRRNIKWIKSIWHWEWAHNKYRRIRSLGAEILLEFLIFAIYKFWKGWLFKGVSMVMQMPPWFYAFLGIDSRTETGGLSFFLFYALTLMSAWNIWNACKSMMWAMDRDESCGSIYLICGQWFDRKQLAWGRWSWNAVVSVLMQVVLYIWVMLLAFIGSLNVEQSLSAAARLLGGLFSSVMALLLFVSLSFLYSAAYKRRPLGDFSFRSRLFIVSLAVGNLYKLRDALFAILEQFGKPAGTRVMELCGWFNGLYWLSPLSWMNLVVEVRGWQMFLQWVLCAGISAAAVVLGVKEYQKREFF